MSLSQWQKEQWEAAELDGLRWEMQWPTLTTRNGEPDNDPDYDYLNVQQWFRVYGYGSLAGVRAHIQSNLRAYRHGRGAKAARRILEIERSNRTFTTACECVVLAFRQAVAR